jgi:hypothetical protein
MLQLLHIDIAKVDWDVAHVAYFCLFQWYVAYVLKNVSSVFRRMLQQVFYLDVAYVSHTCCKYFIWILHMFHTYVALVCFKYFICVRCMLHPSVFMLQVFYEGTVSDGRTTQAPRDGAR